MLIARPDRPDGASKSGKLRYRGVVSFGILYRRGGSCFIRRDRGLATFTASPAVAIRKGLGVDLSSWIAPLITAGLPCVVLGIGAEFASRASEHSSDVASCARLYLRPD